MDNNIYNKECLLNVIKKVNKVIYKWIYINNISVSKITHVDINSLFLSIVKKYLIIYYPDFNKFSKQVRLSLDQNKYIENIYIVDNEFTYSNMNIKLILEDITKLTKEDYINCLPQKDYENELIYEIKQQTSIIDYIKIKSIIF
jgi:hypothetical protein